MQNCKIHPEHYCTLSCTETYCSFLKEDQFYKKGEKVRMKTKKIARKDYLLIGKPRVDKSQ